MPESPQIALKVVVIVHFVLTAWATIAFLDVSYVYMNGFILAFGMWSIISNESVDAVLMFLLLNLISILMDVIYIGIFASSIALPHSDAYRFSLGMAILNLILKPFTSYILYRLYQDRRGENAFPAFGIRGQPQRSGYDVIGSTPSAPYSYVETAVPHSTIEKTPSSS